MSMTAHRVLVAFADAPVRGVLRFLKPGFRHCFVAVEDAGVWVMIDALAGGTEIRAVPVADLPDPAAFWRGFGVRVVATTTAAGKGRRRFLPAPFTCVEAAKRVLGLNAPLVLTPWQLYRRLEKKPLTLPSK